MGLVVRSTKAGATTSFATSFSLGNTLAIADLDTDLNTLYSLVNGNIDTNNIATDGVGSAEIAALAVTTAKINDLNVTVGKLALGASVNASIRDPEPPGDVGWVGAALSGVAETTMRTTAITTRGGPLFVSAQVIGGFADASGYSLTVRLKVDGVQVAKCRIVSPTFSPIIAGLSLCGFVPSLGVGAHSVTVTGEINVGGKLTSSAGWTQAYELA